MLLLDRKINEEISLVLPDGRTMSVKIVDLTSKSARIGIAAPKDVKVFRHEIYCEKKRDGSI